ncbi:choice-of-anchor F family protein [Ectothiorhodospiraceae bacterium WFHF3C12]|nr:choice-of-anchor F family protein [Ectothiorhodospiraceae bacterium WFHF3C12]
MAARHNRHWLLGGAMVAAVTMGVVAVAAKAQTTLQTPALTAWSDTNALTVDPDSPETGRTYLYPDTATRDMDQSGAADGTGSRAYIHWDIDSGLGEPPGVQSVTNDYDFPRRNCIMASGTDATSLARKTCSDPQGSAKRFWLTITEADQPVDVVFETGQADIVYDEGIDPTAEGFEVGRIYRVIQKLANHTGERIQGFRMELGFGTGDDFTPASFADDDVAFELRPSIPRSFFGEAGDIVIDPGHGGGQECTVCHSGNQQLLREAREVWLPGEYATFSPKMFDVEDGGRFVGVPGFFDEQIAGLVPPQEVADGDKSQYIASGDTVDPATGIIGPTTANYFDIPANQGAGAGLSGNIFGYLLPDGRGAPGIYEDDDGDPATEGDLVAWWDGSDWRWGNERNFAVVPDSQLAVWARRPLSEDEVLEPPRYEVGPIDDVSALNVDTFIYIGEDFDPEAHPTRTVRYEVTSIASGTVAGTEMPPWSLDGNEPTELTAENYPRSGDDEDFFEEVLGCTYSPGAPFDPLLPGLLAGAIGLLAWRRTRTGPSNG